MNIPIFLLLFFKLSISYQICGFKKNDRFFEIPSVPRCDASKTFNVTQTTVNVFKLKDPDTVRTTKCWNVIQTIHQYSYFLFYTNEPKIVNQREESVNLEDCKKDFENAIEVSPNIWKSEKISDEVESPFFYGEIIYTITEKWKENGTIKTFDGINVISGIEIMDNCSFLNEYCETPNVTIFWNIPEGMKETCRYELSVQTDIVITDNQVIIPQLNIFTEHEIDGTIFEKLNNKECQFSNPYLLKNGYVIDFINNLSLHLGDLVYDDENDQEFEIFRKKRELPEREYEIMLSMVAPPFKFESMIMKLFNKTKIEDIPRFETNPIKNTDVLQELKFWNVNRSCLDMRQAYYKNEGNSKLGPQLIVLKCIRIAQYEQRERKRLDSKKRLSNTEKMFRFEVRTASFSLFDRLLEEEFGKAEKDLSEYAGSSYPNFNDKDIENVQNKTKFVEEFYEIERSVIPSMKIAKTRTEKLDKYLQNLDEECEEIAQEYRIFHRLLSDDETSALRYFYKTDDLVARWFGDLLSLGECNEVKPKHIYWDHKVNGSCWKNLPVLLENNEIWYKLPGKVKDLMQQGQQVTCESVRNNVYFKNGRWETSDGKRVALQKMPIMQFQETSRDFKLFETNLEDGISFTPFLKQKYSIMFDSKLLEYVMKKDAASIQDLKSQIKKNIYRADQKWPFVVGFLCFCLIIVILIVLVCWIKICINRRKQSQGDSRIFQVTQEMETIERNDIFDEYPLPGPRR